MKAPEILFAGRRMAQAPEPDCGSDSDLKVRLSPSNGFGVSACAPIPAGVGSDPSKFHWTPERRVHVRPARAARWVTELGPEG